MEVAKAFSALALAAVLGTPAAARVPDDLLRRERGGAEPATMVREGPPLGRIAVPRFAVAVDRLERCGPEGDAVVTTERRSGADDDPGARLVVHRRGAPCFAILLPGRAGGPFVGARPSGLARLDGSAGPLAVAFGNEVARSPGGDERRFETHLAVVSWEGELLLDRALEVRAWDDGVGSGEEVGLTPLVWTGERLLAWASVQRRSPLGVTCQGSLLAVPQRGPIAVAEGLPCTVAEALDVDDDGELELFAAAGEPDELRPWAAIVDVQGDLEAVWTDPGLPRVRLVPGPGGPALLAEGLVAGAPRAEVAPWPWNGPRAAVPLLEAEPAIADADGDGAAELLVPWAGETRIVDRRGTWRGSLPGEPLGRRGGGVAVAVPGPAGIRSAGARGDGRLAPPALAAAGSRWLVRPAFDWTGDGTADLGLIAPSHGGRVALAVWAEGEAVAIREADGPEGLVPRQRARRALDLGGPAAADVLVEDREGFVVVDPRSGVEVRRWNRDDGVLDAWAIPVSGRAALVSPGG